MTPDDYIPNQWYPIYDSLEIETAQTRRHHAPGRTTGVMAR